MKGLNISLVSGVFTAPRSGVYLITFSYWGGNYHGEATRVYLHHNEVRLREALHQTQYDSDGSGFVESTGGRAVYLRLKAGDTLTLQTDTVTGSMYHIMFCVQFINN